MLPGKNVFDICKIYFIIYPTLSILQDTYVQNTININLTWNISFESIFFPILPILFIWNLFSSNYRLINFVNVFWSDVIFIKMISFSFIPLWFVWHFVVGLGTELWFGGMYLELILQSLEFFHLIFDFLRLPHIWRPKCNVQP